mmetsp:Transcript_4629/g.18550  ORF Transcript_4629/g.18550 Transcript_4629/m.18550 type:complete len:251 (-) Transcript_4629:1783-2535(-)
MVPTSTDTRSAHLANAAPPIMRVMQAMELHAVATTSRSSSVDATWCKACMSVFTTLVASALSTTADSCSLRRRASVDARAFSSEGASGTPGAGFARRAHAQSPEAASHAASRTSSWKYSMSPSTAAIDCSRKGANATPHCSASTLSACTAASFSSSMAVCMRIDPPPPRLKPPSSSESSNAAAAPAIPPAPTPSLSSPWMNIFSKSSSSTDLSTCGTMRGSREAMSALPSVLTLHQNLCVCSRSSGTSDS